MDYVTYDSQRLAGRTISFFSDEGSGVPDVSAATLPEKAVVRWLFQGGPASNFVRGTFCEGGPIHFAFEAEGRLVDGARIGDVDVVLGGHPEQALALECKRLTVRTHTPPGGHPGKLGGLKKAYHQTTALLRMGFHRAALVLVVQTEGWDRPEDGAYVFRGARSSQFEAALDDPSVRALPAEAGLVLIEVIHPTRRPIGDAGAVGVHVVRPGAPRVQPMGLTDRVRETWADGRWS